MFETFRAGWLVTLGGRTDFHCLCESDNKSSNPSRIACSLFCGIHSLTTWQTPSLFLTMPDNAKRKKSTPKKQSAQNKEVGFGLVNHIQSKLLCDIKIRGGLKKLKLAKLISESQGFCGDDLKNSALKHQVHNFVSEFHMTVKTSMHFNVSSTHTND